MVYAGVSVEAVKVAESGNSSVLFSYTDPAPAGSRLIECSRACAVTLLAHKNSASAIESDVGPPETVKAVTYT